MRPKSIHLELVAKIVGSGAAATLALSIGILAHDHEAFQNHVLGQLDVQANAVGESCTAALEFGDARDAAELLRSLRGANDVVQAAVYARDGSRLAHYQAPGFAGALPDSAPAPRRSIGERGAVVVRPVLLDGEQVGTIYVHARTDEIRERFRQQAMFLVLLFGAVGAVLGALLLACLKRTITDPIEELARVAVAVRRSGDYSRRVGIRSHDELGLLADSFNRMLAAIEEREAELARQRRTLEDTVALRTTQLAAKSEQLAQAQKIEALGRLAGGIAHDFNNILAVVVADSRALVDELPEGEHRTCAKEIAEAGHRGAALTRQLLAFGRKQVLNPRPLDVSETIANVSKMLSRLIGEDIRVVVDVRPGLRTVYMDPAQLEQALVNLALNGRDAMPSGGTLRFEVSEEHVCCGGEGDPGDGACVRISVSDTGCGMSPEVLRHVFEPFFTTKPQGKGTGLGLAMVHGAVEQSGGHVTVESAQGMGSTFTLCLPAMHRAVEELDASIAPDAVPLGAGETVLLVEDDHQLRAAVRRMLVSSGYRVLEAASGEEALNRVQSSGVDLVLTDIVMPGLGGLALGRILAERSVGTPILYMSGYSDEMLAARGAPSPGRFIAKPFEREELLRRVRPLLEGSGTSASARDAA